jgi:parallel beta-helix repeat protein
MILKMNPSLTPSEVKSIIINKCEKVGTQPYSGGKNDYLGYGRINAFQSLCKAAGHGRITEDGTFTGKINFSSTEICTVAAGVTLQFKDDANGTKGKLVINKKLIAIGTGSNYITFKPVTAGYFKWQGLRFDNHDSKVQYCKIYDAGDGILVWRKRGRFEYNKIYTTYNGIYLYDCWKSGLYVRYNQIYDGYHKGIKITGGEALNIKYNTLDGNVNGIWCESSADPYLYDNHCEDNTNGLYLYGTGNNPDLTEGFNSIWDSNTGIHIASGNYPILNDGYNSIKNNLYRDIYNDCEPDSGVWNYWGGGLCDYDGFHYESDPYLTSEPTDGPARVVPRKIISSAEQYITTEPSDFRELVYSVHHYKAIEPAFTDDMMNQYIADNRGSQEEFMAREMYLNIFSDLDRLPEIIEGTKQLYLDCDDEDMQARLIFSLGDIYYHDYQDEDRAAGYYKDYLDNYPDHVRASDAAFRLELDPETVGARPLAKAQKEEVTKLTLKNYPNPFNPETSIQFNLPADTPVILKVYNIQGQVVKTLIEKKLPAGPHKLHWSGRDDYNRRVPSGVYFLRLRAGSKVLTRKIVLIK